MLRTFRHSHINKIWQNKAYPNLSFKMVKSENELEAVTQFYFKHFLIDEPASESFGGYGGSKARHEGIQKQFQDGVFDGLTIYAEEKGSQDVIGVVSGYKEERKSVMKTPQVPLSQLKAEFPIGWAYLIFALDELYSSREIFRTHPELDVILHKFITGVRNDHGRRGIGTILSQYLVEAALEAGCQAMWTTTTHNGSKRINDKLGLSVIKTMDWDVEVEPGVRPFHHVNSDQMVAHLGTLPLPT